MDYAQAARMVAHYQHQLLPQFADGWSRWPTGQVAHDLAAVFDSQTTFYSGLSLTAQANDCRNLAQAIRQHSSSNQ